MYNTQSQTDCQPQAIEPASWALKNTVMYDHALSPTARCVFHCIADFAANRGYTFARQKVLAEKIGIGVTAFKDAIKELEAAKYITCERVRGSITQYAPNRFRAVPSRNPATPLVGIRLGTEPDSGYIIPIDKQDENNKRECSLSGPSPNTEKETPMGRIVGSIRRIAPGNENGSAPRATSSAQQRQAMLRECAQQFAQKHVLRADTGPAALRAWASLIEHCGGQNAAMQAADEAFAHKHRLLNDEHPVFGVHTVLFYVRYKRKETPAQTSQAPSEYETFLQNNFKEICYTNGVLNLDTARKWIEMRNVSRDFMRGVCTDSELDLLYAP